MTTHTTVTRVHVPEDQRLTITEKLFGTWFPTRIEPVVYTLAERLSRDYKGGYWDFYTLSNGGFYMAPAGDRRYHVICENQFEGDLSADTFGITVCLYTFSNLSFSGPDAFADICFDHYHWLREYMMQHAEVEAILGGTD
jgi:Antirestriction protein